MVVRPRGDGQPEKTPAEEDEDEDETMFMFMFMFVSRSDMPHGHAGALRVAEESPWEERCAAAGLHLCSV